MNTGTPIQAKAVPVSTAAKLLGISRAWAYQLVRDGSLRAKRVGNRWLVPLASIDAFLEPTDVAEPSAASEASA